MLDDDPFFKLANEVEPVADSTEKLPNEKDAVNLSTDNPSTSFNTMNNPTDNHPELTDQSLQSVFFGSTNQAEEHIDEHLTNEQSLQNHPDSELVDEKNLFDDPLLHLNNTSEEDFFSWKGVLKPASKENSDASSFWTMGDVKDKPKNTEDSASSFWTMEGVKPSETTPTTTVTNNTNQTQNLNPNTSNIQTNVGSQNPLSNPSFNQGNTQQFGNQWNNQNKSFNNQFGNQGNFQNNTQNNYQDHLNKLQNAQNFNANFQNFSNSLQGNMGDNSVILEKMKEDKDASNSYMQLLEEKLFNKESYTKKTDPELKDLVRSKLIYLKGKIIDDQAKYRKWEGKSKRWALTFRVLSSLLAAVVTVLLGINVTDVMKSYYIDWYINTSALLISAFISIIGVVQGFFDANELYIKYTDTANKLEQLLSNIDFVEISIDYIDMTDVNAIYLEYNRIIESTHEYEMQIRADSQETAGRIRQQGMKS